MPEKRKSSIYWFYDDTHGLLSRKLWKQIWYSLLLGKANFDKLVWILLVSMGLFQDPCGNIEMLVISLTIVWLFSAFINTFFKSSKNPIVYWHDLLKMNSIITSYHLINYFLLSSPRGLESAILLWLNFLSRVTEKQNNV